MRGVNTLHKVAGEGYAPRNTCGRRPWPRPGSSAPCQPCTGLGRSLGPSPTVGVTALSRTQVVAKRRKGSTRGQKKTKAFTKTGKFDKIYNNKSQDTQKRTKIKKRKHRTAAKTKKGQINNNNHETNDTTTREEE